MVGGTVNYPQVLRLGEPLQCELGMRKVLEKAHRKKKVEERNER